MKKKTSTIFILATLILMAAAVVSSQTSNVPLGHWVYDFIERMETKRIFSDVKPRTRPMTRQDVAQFLVHADSARDSLSVVELDILDQLLGEFHDALMERKISAQSRYHEKHLLRWREGQHHAYGDLEFTQRFDVNRGDQYSETERSSYTTLGGIVRGRLGARLDYYVRAQNRLERGTDVTKENFDPRQGTPLTISGNNVFSDEAWAYLKISNTWFEAEFGRDQLKWGPGLRGSLMLSSENPPFEMLKLRFHFKKFQFTSFHGSLHAGDMAKYLAGHRLDIALTNWLYIGGAEAVVYGNRDIEPSYLIPIMPYHVAEHHLGDVDNNTMSLDVTIFPARGHKMYFELFLDDFTTAENPFTYYGNKFAFLAGYRWINPFGLSNTDILIEYTRIEPYVYTHKDSVNTYQNYDQSIGHWLGPDSDDLYIGFNWLMNRDLKVTLSGERIRRGQGDIDTPHAIEDGIRKEFLGSNHQNSWSYGLNIRDQLFRDVFLSFSYHYINTRNLNTESGRSSSDSYASMNLSVNW